ncbi:MAG TPA: YihY/virulence factor BrkB family protein [Actinomycetota bacterium]
MSTANPVPENPALRGADARDTLATTSGKELIGDAIVRFRAADGFSHARSMAFVLGLIFVQGVIALVGLASAVGSGGLSRTIVRTLETVVPGAAGLLLRDAVRQAHEAGSSGRWIALTLGLLGALVSGVTLLGQIERALNRIYGTERDRPTLRKYGLATLLTLSAGVLAVVGFATMMVGNDLVNSRDQGTLATVWNVSRWPVAAALLAVATVLVLRWSPRRRQPGLSWLAAGAVVGVTLLTVATIALDLLFRLSTTFGQTYGPLAGLVALSFWTFAASLSLLLGGAFIAQLEAVRAGAPTPRTERADAPTPARPARATLAAG